MEKLFSNPEFAFAVIGMILSFFCQRITLVYARGGIIDQSILSLLLGTIANFVWISSILWFILSGNWYIIIPVFLISIFGFNKLVTPERLAIHSFRNVLRTFAIICLFAMWHSYFL